MASLTFVKGFNQGSSAEIIGNRVTLGRNQDCGVVLNVPAVSREHAVIVLEQGQYFIEDLKSRNGTFVNSKEVTGRMLLKDNDRIKICDNLLAFNESNNPKPLPDDLRRAISEPVDDPGATSTIEASLSHSSKQILKSQPAEQLAFLLDVSTELAQTLNLKELLPKIAMSLFQVFRQGDRAFIIFEENGKLVPRVIRTRRKDDDDARFSKSIVWRCLEKKEALLSEDASSDAQFDASQSIADCKIRSVMCAPMIGPTSNKALGVIQLDNQDQFKKFTQDDLKLLMAVAGQAAVALENANMHQTLVARAGLERDLKLAHQVQLSFLPNKLPVVEGYEFFAFYDSAQEVGGDYYDFIPIRENNLAITCGDVAGKGIPAALLMAKVSSDARFSFLTEPNPADAIYKLNEFMQEAGMLDRFVTLGGAMLDTTTHDVTFVSAGHNPPLVYRAARDVIEDGMPTEFAGFPLGVADGIPFETCKITMEPNDLVVFYTDGVSEAKNQQDIDFGIEAINDAIRNGPKTPKAVGERVMNAVKKHATGRKQFDDITIVCFGRVIG